MRPLSFARQARVAFVVGSLLLCWERAHAEDTQVSTSSSAPEISEEARAHFRAGVAHLQNPGGSESAKALEEFRLAYELSKSWKILGNLGIAAMEVERDGEAIEAFRQYLLKGGPDIPEGEVTVVENDLKTLEKNLGWITVRIVGKPRVVTDERRGPAGVTVTNDYGGSEELLRLGLRAGTHRITVPADDGDVLSWDFQLNPGDKLEKEFVLAREEQVQAADDAVPQDETRNRPVPKGVYLGLGITGALAAGATTMGILTMNKNQSFDDVNDGSQENEAETLRTQVKTYGLVTDILIGATVASAGVTAVLYFTRPSAKPEDSGFRWVPVLGPGTAAMQLAGEF